MQWKKIKTHPHYEVSDTGLVRKKSGSVIGQWKSHNGYPLVRLSRPRAMLSVHRIVAQTFIKNPRNLPCVNHLDCTTDNNCVENLEWCTQRHNIKYAQKLGRMQKDYLIGRRSPNASLSDEIVSEIRKRYENGDISWEKLGKIFNVSKRTVGRIIKNQHYKKVPAPQPPKDAK